MTSFKCIYTKSVWIHYKGNIFIRFPTPEYWFPLNRNSGFLCPDRWGNSFRNIQLARFMSGTPLAAIELEMQLIPGFKPRGGGTFRNREIYVYAPSLPYEELLRLFIKEVQLRTFAVRIEKLLKESEVNPMFFRNMEHRRRFQSVQKSGLFPMINLSE
ncbi:MAG: hypothetical protein PHO36_16730, partial [Parabacteroides sp.]|nr:hypothetical protein [Parabacteroides sp.]